MSKRVVIALAVVVVAGSLTAVAGDSGSGKGHFTNHFNVQEMTEMADGSMVQLVHYTSAMLTADPDHPSNNTLADCFGELRIGADGVVTSGSGSCFAKTTDGHGFSYWWQVEKAATADCPALCGVFGYFGGFGRFDGIKGKGSWMTEADFPGVGSLGSFENSYSIP